MSDVHTCTVCKRNDKIPYVQCGACEIWYHQKCVLPGLSEKQIKKINWYCDDCRNEGIARLTQYRKALQKLNEDKEIFRAKEEEFQRKEEKLRRREEIFQRKEEEVENDLRNSAGLKNDLEKKILDVSGVLASLTNDLPQMINETKKEIINTVEQVGIQTSPSYADAVKRRSKPVEKNLIIVESSDDVSVSSKKTVVANA